MARVVLFTDEPVLMRGFACLLAAMPELELAGECSTASELTELLKQNRPDVVLIDLTPEVTFGLLAQVQREAPGCRLVLWVRGISTELAYQAMELGVRGILRKTLPPDLVTKCLRKVSEGELWFDKALTASFLSAKTVALTNRESQLVSLLSQGLKNKEIATTLSISEGTVKVYLSRLFQKVGVKDRFELALYGLRNLQHINGAGPGGNQRTGASNTVPGELQSIRSLVLERCFPGNERGGANRDNIDQLSFWQSLP